MKKLARMALPIVAATILVPMTTASPAHSQAFRWSFLKGLQVCGSGYRYLNVYDLGPKKALVLLAYKNGGHKCAVTVRDYPYYGRNPVKMGVRLTVKGGSSQKILEYRSRAAGPIRLKGTCVKFGGTLYNITKYSKTWTCK